MANLRYQQDQQDHQNQGHQASEASGFRKPFLRLKLPVRRLVGPAAVGSKMSGARRRQGQIRKTGGYWTMKNGRAVFVQANKPPTAEDRLARYKDRVKKRRLGQL